MSMNYLSRTKKISFATQNYAKEKNTKQKKPEYIRLMGVSTKKVEALVSLIY